MMLGAIPLPVTKILPAKGAVGVSTPALAAPDPALAKAAQAFEAMLMRQMVAAMRSAKLADDPLASNAGNSFRDMADARFADDMAAQSTLRGTSIASLLLHQFGGARIDTRLPVKAVKP